MNVFIKQTIDFLSNNRGTIAAATAILALIGKVYGGLSKFFSLKSKSIFIKILPNYDELRFYCEREHTDIVIFNSGKEPITPEEIIQTFEFPINRQNHLNDARILITNPSWLQAATKISEKSLVVSFDFLNPKDTIVIRVYNEKFEYYKPEFRIVGLGKINIQHGPLKGKKFWRILLIISLIIIVSRFIPSSQYYILKLAFASCIGVLISNFVDYLLKRLDIKLIKMVTRRGQ